MLGFLNEHVAVTFSERASDGRREPVVLYHVHLGRPRRAPTAVSLQAHVNLLRNDMGELEFLFAPYSVFTVTKVEWAPMLGQTHLIILEAALDNFVEDEDLPLAPWF